MAWFPGAQRMELQPESDAQPAISPTQLILHSIAAPWGPRRIYEFWRDSTNDESHFGLGYEGDLGQFIGTETRADANAKANRRADGTGAVSVESESNLKHTDPWTDAQLKKLIDIGVWMHQRHGLPLRICRSWTDPGYGYHSLFREWSISGTACPGEARIKQFREIVFPGIVRAAQDIPELPSKPSTPEENDMAVIMGGELNDGFDPKGTLIIPPSVPTGKEMFVNIGADMGRVNGRVDVFISGQGWKRFGQFSIDQNSDLAYYPLPKGTRKVNIKRLPGEGIQPDTLAAWNVEIV